MNREERAPIHIAWALLATLVAFVLLVLLFQGTAQLRVVGRHESYSEALSAVQRSPLTLGLVQAAAFGLVLLLGVRIFAGPSASLRTTLNVRPVPSRVMFLAFVAGMGLQIPLAELANLIQIVAPMSPEQMALQAELFASTDPKAILALFFAVVLVAPFTEELFFRGLILRGVTQRHGKLVGWLGSSVLFGLSHPGAIATILYSMLAGVALGFVAMRTQSILASLVMHAGVNFLPIALPKRVLPIAGFNVPSELLMHVPAPIVIGSLAITLVALAFLVRYTELTPNDD
ncbi:MAG: CPBP family intramembrane metalloprotease [Sandaracinaceae bacterium]|nr:CPBP family intramembrane metalloprotease [Sandaracinaceae bacterium]